MELYRSKGNYELYLEKGNDSIWYITNAKSLYSRKCVRIYKGRAYPVYQIGPTGGHSYYIVIPDLNGFPIFVYMISKTLDKMFTFDQELSRNCYL